MKYALFEASGGEDDLHFDEETKYPLDFDDATTELRDNSIEVVRSDGLIHVQPRTRKKSKDDFQKFQDHMQGIEIREAYRMSAICA